MGGGRGSTPRYGEAGRHHGCRAPGLMIRRLGAGGGNPRRQTSPPGLARDDRPGSGAKSARIICLRRMCHASATHSPMFLAVAVAASSCSFLCVAARSPPRPNVSQPGWNCLIRLTRLDTYEGYKQCALFWLCKCGGGSHELLHDHKNSDAKRWIDYYR